MKEYLNFFHDIVGKVNNWENMDDAEKTLFFKISLMIILIQSFLLIILINISNY